VLDPENSDVLRLVDLKNFTGKGNHEVELTLTGEGSMFYQVVGRYYLPYQEEVPETQPLSIDVNYDKTRLKIDDLVKVSISVNNNRKAKARMVIVDSGIPPGFAPLHSDLEELIQKGSIEKYTATGRQIIVYLKEVPGLGKTEFSYRLRAKFPIQAKTAKISTYEYYNPDINDEALPEELVVTGE